MVLLCAMVGIVTASTVNPSFTYQGVLTDGGGNPLEGTYSLTLSLYDVASGGSALGTDTKSVVCTNGQFTITVAFNPSFFDGRALWLGIRVGADPEMTPRQEILPVPYASTLRPGAVINELGTNYALTLRKSNTGGGGLNVDTTGTSTNGIVVTSSGDESLGIWGRATGASSWAIYGTAYHESTAGVVGEAKGPWSVGVIGTASNASSQGVRATTSGPNSPGVRVETTGPGSYGILLDTYNVSSPGVLAQTHNDNSNAIFGATSGASSYGVYGIASADSVCGVAGSTTGNGSVGIWGNADGSGAQGVRATASGSGSPAIYAESAQDVGICGKGKEGGYLTTNEAGTIWPGSAGLNISTSFMLNPGIKVNTSGLGSYGVFASTNGSDSYGFGARTYGAYSTGMDARTFGESSHGVVGLTNGPHSYGVMARTTGSGSPGVYGESAQDIGVYGKGKEGGYFTTNSNGTLDNRIAGVNVSTEFNFNPGIKIKTNGEGSYGVYLETVDDNSHGVVAETQGFNSQSVFAEAYGLSSNAVYAVAHGNYSDGVVAYSYESNGIKAQTSKSDHKWGLWTDDYIYATGIQAPYIDIAEYMPVTGDATSGTVLIIGSAGKLAIATTEYDSRVAGIVSTSPAITLGNRVYGTTEEIDAREVVKVGQAGNTDNNFRMEPLGANEDANAGEVQVAIAGRVPCKVDASYGAIHPGDLLTTSNTPGYARKAEKVKAGEVSFYLPGTILGKALGTLETGTGTIEVLVTL